MLMMMNIMTLMTLITVVIITELIQKIITLTFLVGQTQDAHWHLIIKSFCQSIDFSLVRRTRD